VYYTHTHIYIINIIYFFGGILYLLNPNPSLVLYNIYIYIHVGLGLTFVYYTYIKYIL
jgi:hypothetical protein